MEAFVVLLRDILEGCLRILLGALGLLVRPRSKGGRGLQWKVVPRRLRVSPLLCANWRQESVSVLVHHFSLDVLVRKRRRHETQSHDLSLGSLGFIR